MFVKKYKFEILFLTIGFIFFVKFCNSFMVELPHLSWFGHFQLIERLFNGTLSFKDLLRVRSGACGLLGYNILFLLNTICFKLTTFFDVYLNDLIVLIIGIICVCQLRKISIKQNFSYIIATILVCTTAFSAIQLSSGAMETQVRLGILFFVIVSVYVDKILVDNYGKKDLFYAIILIFFSINIFGTAYSFAGIPVIFLICLITFIKNKKINMSRFFIVLTYALSGIIYFLQYFVIIQGPWRLKEGSFFDSLLNIISKPFEVVRAICGYNASGLIGSAGYLDGKVPIGYYDVLGAIVTCIMIYALVMFVKLKLYKNTFLPVMFMGYSFFVPLLVMLDREVSVQWVINEWYVVNTKLGIIGTIMILFYVYQSSISKNIFKFFSCAALIMIFVFSIYGNTLHVARAVNVKAYYEAKQPYLFAQSIEELPVDANGLTPLIATPKETMDAINIMKKYKLCVYRYYDAFEKYLKIIKNKE